MVTTEGQDPDAFINDLYHIRDELVEICEVISDDNLLDIVLEGVTDDCNQIKYNAEADDTFTLDDAIYTIPGTQYACKSYSKRRAFEKIEGTSIISSYGHNFQQERKVLYMQKARTLGTRLL